MSAKQIHFFGTARQKAALKRSRQAKAKRNTPKHTSARKHRRRARSRPAARTNAGEIVTLSLNPATPKRRKKTVAKAAHRKRSKGRRRRHSSRRRGSISNPKQMAASRSHRSRRRRRGGRRRSNPAGVRQLPGFIMGGALVIGGAVGTRVITQAVLGAQNKDWLGYGANLAAAFLLGGAAQLVMGRRGTQARNYVILGGVVSTIMRVIQDKTPLGERISKLGLGDYQIQGFLTPQRLVDPLNSAEIEYPAQIRPAPVPVQAGMSGLGRRRLIG